MSNTVRVTRGVWRAPETVADLAGVVAATLAACPADTVVCGATAARLHGLWLPQAGPELIEVIVHCDEPVPAQRSGSRRGEIRARRRALAPDDVVLLGGIPLTSEARTWVDLAERFRPPDLVAAGDSALRGAATADDLQRAVHRAAGRRGVKRARAVLPYLDGRSRSRPESHLRYGLVSAGLPSPAVNVPIYSSDGEWLAEPDLSYDDVRLALEYNGADHASVGRMRRDITRQLDVAARGGWRTVTFGPAEVFGRIDQTVAFVRALRRERT